jgi:hypothetical protein
VGCGRFKSLPNPLLCRESVEVGALVSALHHAVCLACPGFFDRSPGAAYWAGNTQSDLLSSLILSRVIAMLNTLFKRRILLRCASLRLRFSRTSGLGFFLSGLSPSM